MAILGLLDTGSFSAERFTNVRRSVFYFYPNGAAPLTGLLSLATEESTNDPEFKWYEKRLTTQNTTTRTANAAGPFTTSGGNADSASPFTVAQFGVIRIAVTDAANTFRVGHQIKIAGASVTGATTDLFGTVTLVNQTGGAGSLPIIEVSCTTAFTAVLNTTVNNGLEVWVVGSSFQQGISDISSAIYNLPVGIINYSQIFRTPFSFTGTALKTSAKFDETGVYKDKAKEHTITHMIEMEKAFIFGQKALNAGSPPTYTTGGILSFLQLWEAGATYGNTAATLDSQDNKRIISNAAGVLSEKQFDGYLERVFRVTNNMANEKLCLCGSGFLNVINQLYKSKSVLNANLPLNDTYGMNVVQHKTPFGDVYYKSHPLFSQNNNLRFNALFLDLPNLRYRYVDGRDTTLLKNRQSPDFDGRKDEWLSEAGVELRFPESHMYLQNVRDYAP